MAEAARVYAEALFEVGQGQGQARRDPRASSASSPTRVDGNRELQVFFFSPYFSSAEKVAGLKRARQRRRRRSCSTSSSC